MKLARTLLSNSVEGVMIGLRLIATLCNQNCIPIAVNSYGAKPTIDLY